MDYHDSLISENFPGRINEEELPSSHLSEANPVYDLENYFKYNPNIAFVVIREHHCDGKHQSNPLPDTISIVSQSLLEAMTKVATCSLDKVDYHAGFPRPEMAAPYFFLYHHRRDLLRLAKNLQPVNSRTSAEITTLLNYVNEAEGEGFREADQLLQQGNTNRRHYRKLFRPNEIVIFQNKNGLSACVPYKWPKPTQEGLNIACWSWHLQGKWLQRRHEDLTLSLLTRDNIAIQDLTVYPLRYASPDVRDRLRSRGQKYWNMRHQTFVSYSGDDFLDEQHHVSIPIEVPFPPLEIYV